MEVNPALLFAPSVRQGLAAGGQAEQVGIVSQTPSDMGEMEIVAQSFAKLERAVLQWFFAQRPELGDTMAQLLSLQEQLNSQSIGGAADSPANPSEKLAKMLDLMNMLLISPQGELGAHTGSTAKLPLTLPALIGELEQYKKEEAPAVQAKIDNFIDKLTSLLKQISHNPKLTGDAGQDVQTQRPGTVVDSENISADAEKGTAKDAGVADEQRPVSGNTGAKPDPGQNSPAPAGKAGLPVKNEEISADISDERKTAAKPSNDGEITADNVKPEIKSSGNNKTTTVMPQNAVYEEKPKSSAATGTNGGGTVKTAHELTDQGQLLADKPELLPEKPVDTGALLNKQNVPEFNSGQSINNATVIQQKLQEILQQFVEEFKENELNDKLLKVQQDLTECIKSLQINPEREWGRLLRYPVIYKQALSKALKLLQELANTKDSEVVHQNTVSLLKDLTANLHVQNEVNQLRQENPANQTMYFQIPLQIGNDIRNGEMLVVHQREKRGNKWELTDSWYRFYLETQYLGPVQINLHAANKQLNIQFLLADRLHLEIFNQQKEYLKQVLIHYGYEVPDITCGVSKIAPLFLIDTDKANHQCVDIVI